MGTWPFLRLWDPGLGTAPTSVYSDTPMVDARDIRQHLDGLVATAVAAAVRAGDLPDVAMPVTSVERPKDTAKGDFASTLPLRLARSAMKPPLQIAQAMQGKSRPQVRQYRANFLTSYRLAGLTDQSLLKRFAVGGSARWEDKGAIGFRGRQQAPAIITALDANQICVQVMHSNGLDLCQSGSVTCEARHPSCAGTACTPDCNFWQCGQGVDAGVLSCLGRVATCPEAIAGALQCWGP